MGMVGWPHWVGRACSTCGGRLPFALFFARDGGGWLAWGRHDSGLAVGLVGEGVYIDREQ
eukprot:9473603-Pyramimonas_sp.AAC.1